MTTQVGRKDDDGKVWAGTVLAGFRDVLEAPINTALIANLEDESEHDLVREALSALLDTDLTIEHRFTRAALALRKCPTAIRGACDVGSYGARKYERDNWLHVPDGISRYYEAAGRHIRDMLCGEEFDAVSKGGSGLSNLSHVCWNIFAGATLVNRAKTSLNAKGAIKLPVVLGCAYRTRDGRTVRTFELDPSDSSFKVYDVHAAELSEWWVGSDGRTYPPVDAISDSCLDLVEGPLS